MLKQVARAVGALGLGIVLSGALAGSAAAQTAPMTVEIQPGVSAKIIGLKHVPNLPDVVQLDYEITNAGTTAVALDEIGIGREAYGLNEITLLDFPNKISFRVGVADQCLCTQPPEKPLAPGETFKAWAWFQPPATSSGPFAVRFGSAHPILDVPLQ